MKEKGDLLEVGDILYLNLLWGGLQKNNVDRVTPKQAILENGTKVKRELTITHGDSLGVGRIGDYWYFYILETESIKEEYYWEQHTKHVNSWFSTHQFTQDEKDEIFSLFKD